MAHQHKQNETLWRSFHGPNLAYIQDQYDTYQRNPDNVQAEWKSLFAQWGSPYDLENLQQSKHFTHESKGQVHSHISIQIERLAQYIRSYGHVLAGTDPLQMKQSEDILHTYLDAHGLRVEDLLMMPASIISTSIQVDNALQALNELIRIYTYKISFQFAHVNETEERKWLQQMIESESYHVALNPSEKTNLLQEISWVEGFEKYLQQAFQGQKRFSAEGTDMMVPMLNDLIRLATGDGTCNINIGMAHRGRLNVLAHVLEKPYEIIFSEFHRSPDKALVPSEGSMGINYGWTGDVKYHLGADRKLGSKGVPSSCRIMLANNPSHLEFVNPVVQGMTREAQEQRSSAGFAQVDNDKAMAILLHGDAAFPGEGVASESLNISQLRGCQTGGSIHLIINNQLGFTTEPSDARSTSYASDLAKGFEIPIVHVNADDPEACLAAIRLAYAYRTRFHKDFLIDLVGYRRFGHNEMDDPAVTQYEMYERVKQQPTVRYIYAKQLHEEGLISEEQAENMYEEVYDHFKDKYELMEKQRAQFEQRTIDLSNYIPKDLPHVETAIPLENLQQINQALLNWPDGFNPYPKLEKILMRRKNSFQDGQSVDWALAEIMAYATILQDGKPVRLTGQDVERGTFAHRHLVLHDIQTNQSFSPLHHIPQAKASFSIYNSPLSEVATLGFEYGYDVFAPDTLVLWEAQYGDFSNVAQVIIDQFMSSGKAKWGQKSSLVLLLPHGYEGQGPEHSSARLERFLQLSAENNWSVVNLSTSAQLFHVLRRQAALIDHEQSRPLIVMTPKSLIRHKRTTSPASAFSEGEFRRVIQQDHEGLDQDHVQRLLLCSGKISIDLAEELDQIEKEAKKWLYMLRIEQLYPFPDEQLLTIFEQFENVREIYWVQEEPKNMGAWTYMQPRLEAIRPAHTSLQYVGRPSRSSPATGSPNRHNHEQQSIIEEALRISSK